MHPSSRSQEDPFYGFESINSIHLLEICNSLGALCRKSCEVAVVLVGIDISLSLRNDFEHELKTD
ncbi:hypothetical protein M0657_009860 [Pyricularia oryzae]|uniref:Uncharacterized protein n=1 Tax=Pyricularia oryzae TaxID=318829 RepID=A0A4P7MWK1_PYROR|nr:hypothetical protein M9X92_009408 [Pyricularia oryzae]KAI7913719.1 hypothetical protein M0657_009860 [Pyricularia oryzae]QBZ53591.1 hypothetical protein PoMZ_09279 [Pyricularia oryzae]